jgi:short-subunit dehydrogenase involved in D-alanine esterification of teichoic acids
MTSSFSTILLIGGTSGIGEALARRFHALGKHLIITGRRADRLAALASSLPGTSTYELDITDFPSLAPKIATIIADHPDINTVFLNAGMQKSFSFLDSASITPDAIQEEINTNLTAPVLLTRLLLPHLLKVSEKDKPAMLIYTSSGLAFMPLGIYPVYCATKAAVSCFPSFSACVGVVLPVKIPKHTELNAFVVREGPPAAPTHTHILALIQTRADED